MTNLLKSNRGIIITFAIVLLLIILISQGLEPKVWVSILLSGVTLAALYFLLASGLSLIFGLMDVLNGKRPEYRIPSNPLNKTGSAKAQLVGGNLSVLYSLLGSVSFPETNAKILFIEDLDEYLYHIDRMMMGLKRAGVFDGLKGLVVGGMTDMNDNTVPFGKTAEEIISEHVCEFDFPVCFGFPAGHIPDNLPLIMGAEVELSVEETVSLKF